MPIQFGAGCKGGMGNVIIECFIGITDVCKPDVSGVMNIGRLFPFGKNILLGDYRIKDRNCR